MAKNVTTKVNLNYAVESARSAGATQGNTLSAFSFWLSKKCASGRGASTYFHLLPWLTVISRLSGIWQTVRTEFALNLNLLRFLPLP